MNAGGKFYDLTVPELENIRDLFQKSLSNQFEVVESQIIDCPDLSAPPFNLAAKGLNGNVTIVDVGGFANLLPRPNLEAKFSLAEVAKSFDKADCFICGAGAGPFHEEGANCEMVANISFNNGNTFLNKSLVAILKEEKNHTHPLQSNNFALLGQFVCSDGSPGKVININLKKRKVDGSVVSFMQKALAKNFGTSSAPVGIGGVVLMKKGVAKIHVMPKFSNEPLDCPKKVNDWLVFFEVKAPFVAVGEFLSHDPDGLDLRLEHFHGFTSDMKQAGHFHYDLDPDNVEYSIYLVVASRLLRQSQPSK